jgi:hypothetical protein
VRQERVSGKEEYFPGAETDVEGFYEVRHLPTGSYTLEVRTERLKSAHTEVHTEDGQVTESVNFSLAPGESISGRVFDIEGRPVEGAKVKATVHGFLRPYDLAKGTTDVAGGFHLQWSDERNFTLSAAKKGYEASYLRDRQRSGEVTIVLERSGIISGTVRAQGGGPIPEVNVIAVSAQKNWDKREATTDTRGCFELAVGAGSHRIQAIAENVNIQ